MRKNMISGIVVAFWLISLALTANAEAQYFVALKTGNIRSGPGTKYKVIAKTKRWDVLKVNEYYYVTMRDWWKFPDWVPLKYDYKPEGSEKAWPSIHESLGVVVFGESYEVEPRVAEAKKYNWHPVFLKKFLTGKCTAWKATRNTKRIKSWPEMYSKACLEGKVLIGMTEDMAEVAWGSPSDINTTKTAFGTHEQWVYQNRYTNDMKFLYFEDGILTTIQY